MTTFHLIVTTAQRLAAEDELQKIPVGTPPEESLPLILKQLGVALVVEETKTSCGHKAYGKAAGAYRCATMSCANYYMKHWTAGKR